MRDGYVRAVAVSPEVALAHPSANAAALIDAAARAADDGAALIVFPELALTGATCGDLFFQDRLLDEAERALTAFAHANASMPGGGLCVVGLPWRHGGRLFNAAAVVHRGRVLGVAAQRGPRGEARRWFSPGPACGETRVDGQAVPFGHALRFAARRGTDAEDGAAVNNFVLGVEIGTDIASTRPPSPALCEAGATVIAHPSADAEGVEAAAYRRRLLCAQSTRTVAAYVHAGAGEGESTTDFVFGGHRLMVENGAVVMESPPFADGAPWTTADLDLGALAAERRRRRADEGTVPFPVDDPTSLSVPTAPVGTASADGAGQRIEFVPDRIALGTLRRPVDPNPFVPSDPAARAERCRTVLSIQTAGLATRLRRAGARAAVLGLSGGLDSALAFVVAARAVDRLGWPRSTVWAIAMPGFGTTARTRGNAEQLAAAFGATQRTIPIHEAVARHFADIGHDPAVHDATYENSQARERTQILMDLANQSGGLVVGTGDLSELALGWATYNGDHMAMYGVNAGIPKTLVRHLVAHVADTTEHAGARAVLRDILDTPVSPELLPPEDGRIAQETEKIVGPYALHDFFLYHFVRHGRRPRLMARLAEQAFAGRYASGDVRKVLTTFLRRFFAQQFKRSCMPDGPTAGTVGLSPRGGWRGPSDAESIAWREDLDEAWGGG